MEVLERLPNAVQYECEEALESKHLQLPEYQWLIQEQFIVSWNFQHMVARLLARLRTSYLIS